MSEPTPDAIPTSALRGPPPRKKPRNLPPSASAAATQANEIENLMYYHDESNPLTLPSSTTNSKSEGLAPPPEIVSNVQGSSAGAGSGEFHVYKASRRREYERLRLMEEESRTEEETKVWEEEERRRKREDEERTRKNKAKRERRKKAKGGEKREDRDLEGGPVGQDGEGTGQGKLGGKKEIAVLKARRQSVDEDDRENEKGGATNGAGPSMGVAQVMKENGITIHDDD